MWVEFTDPSNNKVYKGFRHPWRIAGPVQNLCVFIPLTKEDMHVVGLIFCLSLLQWEPPLNSLVRSRHCRRMH